jgi:hypothetical protein
MPGERDRLGNTPCSFLKFERHIASEISPFTDTRSTPSATEEILEDGAAEDISEGFENVSDISEPALPLDTRMAIAIVASTFLIIAQDLIGFGSFLELERRVRIPLIGVGMVLHRQFSVSLGDIRRGGGPFHP